MGAHIYYYFYVLFIKRFVIFILLLAGEKEPLAAQKIYSLKDCIRVAFEKSVQLKQTYLNQQLAKNNYNQTKNDLLPSVSLDMSGAMSLGNSLNPTTYEVEFRNAFISTAGVGAQMILFSGLQQINNIERNKLLSESAKADMETFKNNLALTVSNTYLQLLLAKEVIETVKIQSRNMQEQIERTKKLIEAGVLPKGNLLELQAQKARDELNVVKAQNDYQLLEFQMKQLLLMPLSEEIIFEQSYRITGNEYDIQQAESIINSAIQRMPQVQSEELKVRAARKQYQMAQGALSPTLSFSYFSGSNFISTAVDTRDTTILIPSTPIASVLNPLDNSTILINSLATQRNIKVADGNSPYLWQLKNNLSHRITLSLNLPIFNKFQRMTNIANAKINMMNQTLQLENIKNKLKEDVYSAYIQYKNAKKTYFSSVDNTKAFNNAYEFAKEKYNLGAINAYEYNTSVANKENAESEMLRAKYEYVFRKIVLDFYNGTAWNVE